MPAREPDCLFCKILDGEIPASVVHEDERTLAFMDINPASRGHLLVIPKDHARDVHAIEPGALADVIRTAQLMAGRVVERLGADGVNLLQSSGAPAWQTVFHLHVHVIPRYAGRDGLQLPWNPTPGDRDEIAQAAEALTA